MKVKKKWKTKVVSTTRRLKCLREVKITKLLFATLTLEQAQEIAKTKMPDLNAANLESATEMIKGTARSMGIVIEG